MDVQPVALDVEHEGVVTRRQRRDGGVGRVPRADDHPPGVRVRLERVEDVPELVEDVACVAVRRVLDVDAGVVRVGPAFAGEPGGVLGNREATPKAAVSGVESPLIVGPGVPDFRLFAEVPDVFLAGEIPE